MQVGSGDGYQAGPRRPSAAFLSISRSSAAVAKDLLARILPDLPQSATCFSRKIRYPQHGSRNCHTHFFLSFFVFKLGDAEGRGADADLPERHVP